MAGVSGIFKAGYHREMSCVEEEERMDFMNVPLQPVGMQEETS